MVDAQLKSETRRRRQLGNPLRYRLAKRSVDLVFLVAALPALVICCLVLPVANRVWNPGPLFFVQTRMGRYGKPFRMIKFRTMVAAADRGRGHDDPLETGRITRLGTMLRTYRIDELPNIINIARGQMTLVGPRPDMFDHATVYCRTVPHYDRRLEVTPGITGMAQVMNGYADDGNLVRRKAAYDRAYVQMASFGLDMFILRRTVLVVLKGFGAR
ncbi:sugar transferase [Rhodobacteraceae bacterium KN286]|uniref:Sugar transferase n=2 Tax=Oceanomicrobium pacificus TaxID=2692916 RepID=A0A6B0TKL9_9RHOB|nr:sugar transferase [Oceanomicrobium pacificus]